MRGRIVGSSCVSCIVLFGCASNDARDPTSDKQDEATDERDAEVATVELPGEELSFEVGAAIRTRIDLDALQVVDSDAGSEATDWDLAFVGWEIFTNSGPSGPGDGASFGPLSQESFLFDTIPDVPFIRSDATGGAFMDWYAYDGTQHQLWSKYHVFGVRTAEGLFKVQVMGYYGEVQGAPVSAMYQLRYAEVSESDVGPTKEIENLDGTAGYPKVSSETKSGCITLRSGALSFLTPAEALASNGWDLCFRRDSISVNGEEGGPGEVTAADLSVLKADTGNLEAIQARTADSEQRLFDSVGYEELTNTALKYRGDHIFSQFGDVWYEGTGEDAKPADSSWLVIGSDGERHYSLLFGSIEGNADAAGKVTLRAQKLRAPE